MAGIPPPPVQDDPSSYRWIEWYSKLTDYLNNQGTVPWSSVGKAGSSLGDLATRNHNQLTGIGGDSAGYHLSAEDYGSAGKIKSKAGDPTTTDISSGHWAMFKNTSTGALKLWANDSGTMKSVTLT